jgi:aminopeptidase YwaD
MMEDAREDIDFRAAERECREETDRLIRDHGPRLAGTTACLNVAERIAELLRGFSASVRIDTIRIHPASFYAYTKILPVSYALGMLALFPVGLLGLLPVAGLVAGVAMMVCQFGLYLHLGDSLFPARVAKNVEAVIEPVEEAQRELILSGHHDSAPVARIFSGPFSKLYGAAIFVPYFFFLVELAVLLARLLGAPAHLLQGWPLPFLAAGLPFVAGYFCLVAVRRGSPGAGDNLISSVMVASLGREIAIRRNMLLRTTRLRIVSFDAEEAGLRGAAAYFTTHAAGLKGLPCTHLNFDSLYRLRDLQVLTSDINGTVPLSRPLADRIVACARERGYHARHFSLIFGAGGTDAAESARHGIPSTSIIAMPTEIIRDGLVYHTPRDIVENIEPGIVEACMMISLSYLATLEAGADGERQ